MNIMKQNADFVCDTTGSILTVRIRGEIDHHTASDIRSGIDAWLFERHPRCLAMDLSAVTFMDSSGLGLIMGRYSVMKELGGEMVVCDPSPDIQGILALAGMDRMVKVEYTRQTPPPTSVPAGAGQALPRGQNRGTAQTGSRSARGDGSVRRGKTARNATSAVTGRTEGGPKTYEVQETDKAQAMRETERKEKRA